MLLLLVDSSMHMSSDTEIVASTLKAAARCIGVGIGIARTVGLKATRQVSVELLFEIGLRRTVNRWHCFVAAEACLAGLGQEEGGEEHDDGSKRVHDFALLLAGLVVFFL